jgi:hypothetical protein
MRSSTQTRTLLKSRPSRVWVCWRVNDYCAILLVIFFIRDERRLAGRMVLAFNPTE